MHFVHLHRDEILAEWASEAREAASARGLSDVELRNVIPLCLAALTGGADWDALHRHIESHLADRIRRGFELGEVVEEFAILERCIGRSVRRAPAEQRPTEEAVARVFVTLQSIMVRTADVYQEHMQLDEQREKRYLRLLRQLADEALRSPQAPLEGRLREALKIVQEALSADCVTLCLYNPQTSEPLLKATAGDIDSQDLAASFDLASFTGQIAFHEEATELDDVVTTELAVSEALRFSGIHSVLGVRLPRRRRFLGVMYVGTREQRPFSSREIRRLEALGEGLAIHLDNAMLHAELREHLDELEAERGLRERFIAVLAHDLRGPLQTAKLSALLLKKLLEAGEGGFAVLDRIDKNLDRIDRMICDLLDISLMRAGQQLPLRIDWSDLRTLAEEVAEDLRAVHGAHLDVVGAHELRGMWSHDELKRALWNLAENAVKYGARDRPITIRIERGRDAARVAIHNLGEPLPLAGREHIFDLFARHRAAPRVGESWGLGLSFVRACVEAHGGSVSVESDAVSGTTFTMVLPLDARPYQQQPQHASRSSPAQELGGDS